MHVSLSDDTTESDSLAAISLDPDLPAIAVASDGLKALLADIAVNRDHADFLSATYDRAETIIRAAATYLPCIPAGGVVSIPQGSWIVWRNGDKHVQLVCSNAGEPDDFIYTAITENQRQNVNQPIRPANAAVLADRLRWLQDVGAPV